MAQPIESRSGAEAQVTTAPVAERQLNRRDLFAQAGNVFRRPLNSLESTADAAYNLLTSKGTVGRRPILAAMGAAVTAVAINSIIPESALSADSDPNHLRPLPGDAVEVVPGSGFYFNRSIPGELGKGIYEHQLRHPNPKDQNRLGNYYGTGYIAINGDKNRTLAIGMFERAAVLLNDEANPEYGLVKMLTYAELAQGKIHRTATETIDLPGYAQKILDTMALVGSGGVTLKQLNEANMLTFNGKYNPTAEKPFVDTVVDINGKINTGKSDGIVDVKNVGRENGLNVSEITTKLRGQYGADWLQDLGYVISDGMFVTTKLYNADSKKMEDTLVFIQLCERGGIVGLLRTDPFTKKEFWSPDTDLSGRMLAAAFRNMFEPDAFPLNLGNPPTEPTPSAAPSPEPSPSVEKHLEVERTKYRKTAGGFIDGREAAGWPDSLLGKSGINSVVDPEFVGMEAMTTRIKSIDKSTKTAVVYIDGGNAEVTINIPENVTNLNNRFARAQRTIYNRPISWENKYIYNSVNAYIDIEGENRSQGIIGDVALVFFTPDEFKKLRSNTANIVGFDIYV